jgi:hypothetical protein
MKSRSTSARRWPSSRACCSPSSDSGESHGFSPVHDSRYGAIKQCKLIKSVALEKKERCVYVPTFLKMPIRLHPIEAHAMSCDVNDSRFLARCSSGMDLHHH